MNRTLELQMQSCDTSHWIPYFDGFSIVKLKPRIPSLKVFHFTSDNYKRSGRTILSNFIAHGALLQNTPD